MSEVLLYGMAVLLTVSLRLGLRFRRHESEKVRGVSDPGGRVNFRRITVLGLRSRTLILWFRRFRAAGDSAGGGLKVRRWNERGSWTHRRREVSLTGFLAIGVHWSLELTLFSFLSLEL